MAVIGSGVPHVAVYLWADLRLPWRMTIEAGKDTSSLPLMATLQREGEGAGSKKLSSAPQAGRNQPYISQAYLQYLPVEMRPLFIQSRANESNREHFNLGGRFFSRLVMSACVRTSGNFVRVEGSLGDRVSLSRGALLSTS